MDMSLAFRGMWFGRFTPQVSKSVVQERYVLWLRERGLAWTVAMRRMTSGQATGRGRATRTFTPTL